MIKGENISLNEVFKILDETTQVLEYSRMLKVKSNELEETSLKLKRANTKLKELDTLKDNFLSTISHELRTPLTSIRAFSEILHNDKSVSIEERQNFLGIITKESERLTRLIDQLLYLAKMDARSTDLAKANVDPVAAIQEAVTSMDGLIQEQKIDLTLDLPSSTPDISADRDQVVQVIINVVSNAIKFCRNPGGEILVKAQATRNGLLVCISDNGRGIAPDQQDLIFDKFNQGRQDCNEIPVGTGLGLAICRQIISGHHGHIWAENSQDSGARILFTIPFVAEPEVPN
ncbi:MAG: hypothetical protein COB59_09040 [Rhodospirillaceae bacterium]|nr:MAG: hypothetical protein COB59_09040 [Rhodospirillaceae bacterium]